MPISKSQASLYGKVIGKMLNSGKSKQEAKAIAEAAVRPGHQAPRDGKSQRKKKKKS